MGSDVKQGSRRIWQVCVCWPDIIPLIINANLQAKETTDKSGANHNPNSPVGVLQILLGFGKDKEERGKDDKFSTGKCIQLWGTHKAKSQIQCISLNSWGHDHQNLFYALTENFS